jgi:hypothetical protein
MIREWVRKGKIAQFNRKVESTWVFVLGRTLVVHDVNLKLIGQIIKWSAIEIWRSLVRLLVEAFLVILFMV